MPAAITPASRRGLRCGAPSGGLRKSTARLDPPSSPPLTATIPVVCRDYLGISDETGYTLARTGRVRGDAAIKSGAQGASPSADSYATSTAKRNPPTLTPRKQTSSAAPYPTSAESLTASTTS
jgi:hypothetical protein